MMAAGGRTRMRLGGQRARTRWLEWLGTRHFLGSMQTLTSLACRSEWIRLLDGCYLPALQFHLPFALFIFNGLILIA